VICVYFPLTKALIDGPISPARLFREAGLLAEKPLAVKQSSELVKWLLVNSIDLVHISCRIIPLSDDVRLLGYAASWLQSVGVGRP